MHRSPEAMMRDAAEALPSAMGKPPSQGRGLKRAYRGSIIGLWLALMGAGSSLARPPDR